MGVAPWWLPEIFLDRSIETNTAVLFAGAFVTLFASVYLRPDYPYLWIGVFLLGVVIEWLSVLTVYLDTTRIENRIQSAQAEISDAREEIEGNRDRAQRARRAAESTQQEIEATQQEILKAQEEIEETKENAFSFLSDSQHPAQDSLEDRVKSLEETVGTTGFGDSLSKRVERLERELDQSRRF